MLRVLLRVLLIVMAAAAAVYGGTAAVMAHSEPESSNPPIGGTATETPTQVEVIFTQELVRQGDDSALLVVDADGASVAAGTAEIDDADRTVMRVPLIPDLPNGTYTVLWSSLSSQDGHPTTGSFIFTVAADEVVTPTAEAAPAATDEPATTEEASPEATEGAAGPSPTSTAVVESETDDDDGGIPAWVIVIAVVGIVVVGAGAFGASRMLRSG